MSPKKSILALAAFLLACAVSQAQPRPEEFISPDGRYRACTWYHWQNGNVDKAAVKADLESMKEAGIGEITLFNSAEGAPQGPLEYMGEGWWDAYRFTCRTADSLGLGMGVMNGAGWSVSGGPWVSPADAMQEVAWTVTVVSGPSRFDGVLPEPVPCLGLERDMQKDSVRNLRYYVPRSQVAGHYRDIAVYAFPTPREEPFRIDGWWAKAGYSKMASWEPDGREAPEGGLVRMEDIVDLTGMAGRDGSLSWDVPPGSWTILRIGYQPTGRRNHPAAAGGSGLEVDKLSSRALERYWNSSTVRLLDSSDVVSTVLVDSYEAGHQNWTEGFEQEFLGRMGYDPRPYLPAVAGMVIGSVRETERFLWDYRKVISDLLNENFYGRFASLCHGRGVRLAVEPYGQFGNTDEFSTGADADILAGEFWAGENASSTNRTTIKLASSLSHIYGKETVGAEAFTNGGRIFEVHPGMLKTQGDYFFCLGMNQVWLHSFVHDPYGKVPGMTLGYYGSHFNRRNTWWGYSRPWFDYLARCQYMLRQGESTADILYYMGEDAPSRPPKPEDLGPQVPAGYDFDFCGGSFLSSLKVRKGALVTPSGKRYRLLVIRPRKYMRLSVVKQVLSLARAGAPVCFEAPEGTPGLGDDEAAMERLLRGLAVAKTGPVRYGRGMVFPCKDLGEILRTMGAGPHLEISLPDGYVPAPTQYPGGPVAFVHRRDASSDIFFISNQQAHQAMDPVLTFDVRGRIPELWDPMNGSIRVSDNYEVMPDGRLRMRLHLDGSGSVFVVFRRRLSAGASAGPVAVADTVAAVHLGSGWETSLLPGFSGEGKTLDTDSLSDLSLSGDPGVRYHSGEILYRNRFLADATGGRRYMLDLGRVAVLAQVMVNGKDAGILWCEPYRMDISEYVREGENLLEVKVVNLLFNRVAGDLELPEDREWTDRTGSTAPGRSLARIPRWVADGGESPSGRKSFTAWNWPYMKGRALPPSGLIGPVTITVFERKQLPPTGTS